MGRETVISDYISEAGFAESDGEEVLKTFFGATDTRAREEFALQLSKETFEGKLWSLKQLEPNTQIGVTDLAPPKFEAISTWLGFSNTSTDNTVIAFNDLADLLGVETAFRRWMSIPVNLNERVSSWFLGLKKSEAVNVAKSFVDDTSNLVSRRNVACLLALRPETGKWSRVLKKKIARTVLTDAQPLIQLAEGSLSCILRDAQKDCSVAQMLFAAWVWAEQLSRVMAHAGAPSAELGRWFSTQAQNSRVVHDRRLRIIDVLNPHNLSQEQFMCTILSFFDDKEFDALEPSSIELILKCLSFDELPNVPDLSLFELHMRRNSYRSWLTYTPSWLLTALGVNDSFVGLAFSSPEKILSEQLVSRMPDFVAYSVIGVEGLSDTDATTLMRQIRKSISRAGSNELRFCAELLSKLSLADDVARKMRPSMYAALADRKVEMDKIHGEDIRGTMAIADAALMATFRDHKEWWDDAEKVARIFAERWTPTYSEQLSQLIGRVLLGAPVRFRAKLRRLQAEILATI